MIRGRTSIKQLALTYYLALRLSWSRAEKKKCGDRVLVSSAVAQARMRSKRYRSILQSVDSQRSCSFALHTFSQRSTSRKAFRERSRKIHSVVVPPRPSDRKSKVTIQLRLPQRHTSANQRGVRGFGGGKGEADESDQCARMRTRTFCWNTASIAHAQQIYENGPKRCHE